MVAQSFGRGAEQTQGTGGQGTGAGHWRNAHSSEECGWYDMKMGKTPPPPPPPLPTFYKIVGQMKGPLEAKEPLDAKFRYDYEIFACTNFHLQNNNKNLI